MVQFTTISAPDNNVSDGTRSVQLVISEVLGSNVPVIFYPGSIPVQVIDDDGNSNVYGKKNGVRMKINLCAIPSSITIL